MKLWVWVVFSGMQIFGGFIMGLSVMLALFVMDREVYEDRLIAVGLLGFGAMLSALGFILLFEIHDKYKEKR